MSWFITVIFQYEFIVSFNNLNSTVVIQLHINFITHACAFLIYVLILALIVIKLHINFIIHACAFLIYVLI